jgi:hypothetical protein
MSRFVPDGMLVPFAGITSTGAGSSRSMNLGSRTIARTRKQVPNLLRKIFFWTLLYALSGGSSPQSTRLGNFLASPFASASCIDCSSREAPGPAPPTPIKDKFPVVLRAASVERLLARPGIPVATPLHGARDHDEAVAATAQWFGGFARQLPPLSACA